MNPYFETKLGKLYHGDCLDIIPALTDIGVVLADPPYGIDYQSSWRTDKDSRLKKIENDKRPFIWWLFPSFKVSNLDACLLCFCRWDVQEAFKLAVEWAGYTLKSQVIWDREAHGMGDLKSSFAPQHDVIWFGTKGGYQFPNKRPHSVVKNQRLGGEQIVHPNQKPVGLISDFIESLYISGVVLDPFLGSGTTAIACEKLNVNWVGVEMSEQYCEIAAKRIEAEAAQLKLFK